VATNAAAHAYSGARPDEGVTDGVVTLTDRHGQPRKGPAWQELFEENQRRRQRKADGRHTDKGSAVDLCGENQRMNGDLTPGPAAPAC